MALRLFIATLAACVWTGATALADDEAPSPQRLTAAELTAFLQQAADKAHKPGPASPRGADTCRYANDLECDEPDIGTGACLMHTDYSDCRYLREGETNSCRWANDGECDEPGLGTGVCTQGTDRTDCAGIVHLRFRTDSCVTAYNGVCEERGTPLRDGVATCAPRTDRADCVGRKRPLTITDHFQGMDDRMLMDTSAPPWSLIGQLEFMDGSACSGTLVASDVVLTAAHCVHDDDGVLAPAGTFWTGSGREGGTVEAQIVSFIVAPRYSHNLFLNSTKLDGTDWAYVRINRPLGDELGTLPIAPLTNLDGVVLAQAGYSWDTDIHLSGQLECAAVTLFADGTLEHECDTTRGDSGSPLMAVREGGYEIVGVASNFRDMEDAPPVNIATGAIGFAPYLEDFAAGLIGDDVVGAHKSKGGPVTE